MCCQKKRTQPPGQAEFILHVASGQAENVPETQGVAHQEERVYSESPKVKFSHAEVACRSGRTELRNMANRSLPQLSAWERGRRPPPAQPSPGLEPRHQSRPGPQHPAVAGILKCISFKLAGTTRTCGNISRQSLRVFKEKTSALGNSPRSPAGVGGVVI